MKNGAINTILIPHLPGCAERSDTDLHALIASTYGVPQSAPGLLAWIEGMAERPLTGSDLDRQ